MTENMQVDALPSRQAGFVRCCLYNSITQPAVFCNTAAAGRLRDPTAKKFAEIAEKGIDKREKVCYTTYTKEETSL